MSPVWYDDGQGSAEFWWKRINCERINGGSGNMNAKL